VFIDSAKIELRAGSGEKGVKASTVISISAREKLMAVTEERALILSFARTTICSRSWISSTTAIFFGAHGGHGSSNHKKGRTAEDVIVRVPVGTIIQDAATE